MNERHSESGKGYAQARTGTQALDARYSEQPDIVTDRLRQTMKNAVDGEFLVIGQKTDGTPFLWSTGDKDKTQELAKVAAPELVGLIEG